MAWYLQYDSTFHTVTLVLIRRCWQSWLIALEKPATLGLPTFLDQLPTGEPNLMLSDSCRCRSWIGHCAELKPVVEASFQVVLKAQVLILLVGLRSPGSG